MSLLKFIVLGNYNNFWRYEMNFKDYCENLINESKESRELMKNT